jgi:uncharacterized delta-60 repeat protein
VLLNAGQLDPAFGDGGIVNFNYQWDDYLNAAALQQDGKIVAVGSTGNTFALARFHRDGSLDDSFGDSGRVTIDLDPVPPIGDGFGANYAQSVSILSNGKILVVGRLYLPDTQIVIARFNRNGSLDASFGSGGRVIVALGSNDVVFDALVQPDGKILTSGRFDGYEPVGGHTGLLRFNANGSLDASFGFSGAAEYDYRLGYNEFTKIALQQDGKILAAGSGGSEGRGFLVVRYHADGTLDTTFGVNGMVLDDFDAPLNSPYEDARSLAVDASGRIVAVGVTRDPFNTSFYAIARYLPDGTPDPSFNGNGKTIIPIFGSAEDVAVTPDGKIVVVGQGAPFVIVARYLDDGSLDPSFGDNGLAQLEFYLDIQRLLLQPDGQILVAATAHGSSDSDFVLLRFDDDELPPAPPPDIEDSENSVTPAAASLDPELPGLLGVSSDSEALAAPDAYDERPPATSPAVEPDRYSEAAPELLPEIEFSEGPGGMAGHVTTLESTEPANSPLGDTQPGDMPDGQEEDGGMTLSSPLMSRAALASVIPLKVWNQPLALDDPQETEAAVDHLLPETQWMNGMAAALLLTGSWQLSSSKTRCWRLRTQVTSNPWGR